MYDLDLNYQSGFEAETNGPQWSTENLLINENKLYVLINNAYEWGNTGYYWSSRFKYT